MFRRAVLSSLILSLVLGISVAVARQTGRSHDLPVQYTTLLRLMRCKPPCWIDIIPGVTPISAARDIVRRAFRIEEGYRVTYYTSPQSVLRFLVVQQHAPLSYLRVNVNSDERGIINTVVFLLYMSYVRSTDVATAADVMAVLGRPDWVQIGSQRSANGYELVMGYGDLRRGMSVFLERDHRLRLDHRVRMMLFYAFDGGPSTSGGQRPWRGFSSVNRYLLR